DFYCVVWHNNAYWVF
nr:immunoglobulin light chain junction region [Macaca mulatta]